MSNLEKHLGVFKGIKNFWRGILRESLVFLRSCTLMAVVLWVNCVQWAVKDSSKFSQSSTGEIL